MPTKKIVNSDRSLAEAHEMLDASYLRHRFVRMDLHEGRHRSLDQNSMNFELYTHIGDQLYGGDKEHARRECKLDHGVPILLRDEPAFSEMWFSAMSHREREAQLEAMKYLDVTSIMTRPQNREYITSILDTYPEQGVQWPDYLIDQRKRWRNAA